MRGWIGVPPDVLVFSIEMVQGARPPVQRPSLFLAPRIPLPLSQPTPTAAPFGPEMVQGWQPLRFRQPAVQRFGWSVGETRTVVPVVVLGTTEALLGELLPRPILGDTHG